MKVEKLAKKLDDFRKKFTSLAPTLSLKSLFLLKLVLTDGVGVAYLSV